jgi:hypothetical protein
VTAIGEKPTQLTFTTDSPFGNFDSTSPVYGQPIMLVATVTSPAGQPSGNVTFYRELFCGEAFYCRPEVIGTAPLADGVAALPMPFAYYYEPYYTPKFSATYDGDGEYLATQWSQYESAKYAYKAADTITTVSASSASSVPGETVTFTVAVDAIAPSTAFAVGTLSVKSMARSSRAGSCRACRRNGRSEPSRIRSPPPGRTPWSPRSGLNLGTRDCSVGSAQSPRLYDALRGAGVNAILQLVNAAGPDDAWWSSDAAFAAAERFLGARFRSVPATRRAVH